MKLNERNIFLLDGTGALVSAAFTGVILSLFGLALLPAIYAIYSLSCFVFIKTIKPWMLQIIMAANLFYCVVSGVVIFTQPDLTAWIHLLLGIEILIVLAVVAIEWTVYRKAFSMPR